MLMDQVQFWSLLNQAKQGSGGDTWRQVELVKESLMALSVEEIETFERIYQVFCNRSYNKWLWKEMNTLHGFVSDDSFHYFQAFLIGCGENIFSQVLRQPERVGEFVDVAADDWWLEDLNYAAYEVYQEKTGLNIWQVVKEQELYPLVGYDWLQPVPPERDFFE